MNPDTITPPPPHVRQSPSSDNPVATVREVEAIIDAKLRSFATELDNRLTAAERRANLKQRAMTYGVGGVAGMVVGVAGTLLVQKMRKGRSPAKP